MNVSFKACFSGLMFVLLLGGCAHAKEGSGAAAQPAASEQVQAVTENRQQDVQNRKERQLVLLFQALLQMDRKGGLSISKEQAAGLLPLIRKSRDQGEITADDQMMALELLSAEQKLFYDDLAAKMKERMNGGNRKSLSQVNPEERDKLIEQFKSRKDHSTADPALKNSRGDSDAPAEKDVGTSMEQQLIELLEAKVNS